MLTVSINTAFETKIMPPMVCFLNLATDALIEFICLNLASLKDSISAQNIYRQESHNKDRVIKES